MRKIVAIIGDAKIEKDSPKYKLAFEMGKALIDNGYRLQSGGLNGVMEAAFFGAHSSKKYQEGDTIALLPSFSPNDANKYADIVIPTGLDMMRNSLVANASAAIAIGGGSGTMNEMAFAWAYLRPVISFKSVEGTSKRMADTKIDQRIRYPEFHDSDIVYGVDTVEQAIKKLNEILPKYTRYHKGIDDK